MHQPCPRCQFAHGTNDLRPRAVTSDSAAPAAAAAGVMGTVAKNQALVMCRGECGRDLPPDRFAKKRIETLRFRSVQGMRGSQTDPSLWLSTSVSLRVMTCTATAHVHQKLAKRSYSPGLQRGARLQSKQLSSPARGTRPLRRRPRLYRGLYRCLYIDRSSNTNQVDRAACRHWLRGYCSLGDACGFHHPEPPSAVCKDWISGRCGREACRFVHPTGGAAAASKQQDRIGWLSAPYPPRNPIATLS
eukprot:gene57975-biopygen116621